MKIDREKVIAIIKGLKPLFNDHERASHIKAKGDKDYVTEVDVTVQKIIGNKLHELYPDIQLMSEEKSNENIDFSSDYWILDPVDGTSNLMHNFRHSAVSLAYCENGEVIFGTIYNPFSDELFWAEKGKGAYLNNEKINVSQIAEMDKSLVLFGTCPYKRDMAKKDFELFREVFMNSLDVRRLGSAAMDLAYVACGRAGVYFERDLKPWDYAAGIIIVQEAGGKVIDYYGNEMPVIMRSDIIAGTKKMVDYIYNNYIVKYR